MAKKAAKKSAKVSNPAHKGKKPAKKSAKTTKVNAGPVPDFLNKRRVRPGKTGPDSADKIRRNYIEQLESDIRKVLDSRGPNQWPGGWTEYEDSTAKEEALSGLLSSQQALTEDLKDNEE